MTKFLPYILALVVCIGIVPPEDFLWIFLVTLICYFVLAFSYEKMLPGVAKMLPPTIFLILVSVAISSIISGQIFLYLDRFLLTKSKYS